MTIHAILTVDLNGHVSENARKVFNQSLEKHLYVKHSLTTLWTVQFTPTSTRAGAEKLIREHVAIAASLAGITNYEALVMFGDQPAVEWKTAKSTGSLSDLLGALQSPKPASAGLEGLLSGLQRFK